MKKILTIFLILFGCFIVSGQTENSKAPSKKEVTANQLQKAKELKTTSSPITDQEYAVFMAILGKNNQGFVVVKKIEGGESTEAGLENLTQDLEGLKIETARDYASKRKETAFLEKKFPTKKHYYLITETEVTRFFDNELNWKGFYKKYPKSGGLYSFSRVGFSQDEKQAFVAVGHQWGERSGEGNLYLLKKENNEWIVIKKRGTWVS